MFYLTATHTQENMMTVKVKQSYQSNGVATSVTTRNGVISKFTVWLPAVKGSTQRVTVPR